MAAGKVVVYADGKLTKTSGGEDATIDGNLVVTQNLTVNGTTTTINSTTLSVDDKNIELGSVATPSDTTADGGGITLKGATDHTILWTNSTDSWDFSEHVNLASGKQFKINGTQIASTDLSDGAGLQQQPSEGPFANGDKTKLDGIESGADVTDATNVAAAGAAMDSDFSSEGFMKRGASAGQYSVVASIGYADITAADIDTDLSSVSANDDSLASAKAIKAYVDSQVAGTSFSLGLNADANGVSLGNIVIIDGSGNVTAASDNSTSYILGVASANASSGNDVSVYKEGIVIDIGQAFAGTTPAVGDPLFLGTNGQTITVDAPTSGEILRVGTVITTAGKMLFKVQHIMSN